jgi:hypothetical protein
MLQQGKLRGTIENFRVCLNKHFYCPCDFRFGGRDLQHKEFTLEKSILVTLYGIILKSWSVTPTKLSPRLVFIT